MLKDDGISQKEQINLARVNDLSRLVHIHCNSLKDDILPKFGQKYLVRYYQAVFNSDKNYIYTYNIDGIPCGFIILSYQPLSFFMPLRISDLFVFFLNILKNPLILKSAIIQYFKGDNLPQSAEAEISFIAFDLHYTGAGRGRKLIEFAMNVVRKNGLRYMKTKTSNMALADFYISQFGAVEISSYKTSGKIFKNLKWDV